ncbi:hypothetical protein FIV00_10900 [Labrenzia sp. THAF82]|nr:hypothetical protein FIV00_10900 [Labrenzia sp. THAF82]
MLADKLLENIDLYHFFFLYQLTDDLEYLTLRVDLNEGRFLKIRFGRHDCYRVMDEGDAYRTLHDLYALDVGYSHI